MDHQKEFVAPWIGSTIAICKNRLNIAVLSSNGDIIDNLSEALRNIHANGDFKWKLAILRSYNLENIVRLSQVLPAIDFVIIAADTSRIHCIEWAKEVLDQVHPDLRIRRVVFMNARGLPVNAMAVNASDILTFCTENSLEMFNADVLVTDDANCVARKLLKYLEVSVGIETGIPNLNI